MNKTTRQGGAALVASLMMLLLITLFAVSAMEGATIQGKLANSNRNQQTAFHAAELALREAEIFLQTQPAPGWDDFASGAFDGLYAETPINTQEPWEQLANWTGNGSRLVTVPPNTYAEPPRFMIQRLSETDISPSMNGGEMVRMVRITAMGVGTQSNSRVFLQADYRWQ